MWQRKARNGAIKHGTGWKIGFAMKVLSNVALMCIVYETFPL